MQADESSIDSPKASFDRASTFLRAGDAAMAERICRQALNAHPRDSNLLVLLGAALIRQRKPEEAEHTLSRAVRIYSTFARAHEGLAEALIMQGRLPEALASLEVAEELDIRWIEFFMEGVALNDELLQEDRIHPNAEAQPILLDNAWPIIRATLDGQ